MSLFTRPYSIDHSARRHVLRAFVFGVFVYLFLAVFEPFGLSGSGKSHHLFLLGYGAITTACMVVLNVLIPKLVPRFFNESHWSTGREITWTTLNIVCIGALNYVYTIAMTSFTGGLTALFWFIGITFLIGVFPTTLVVLLKERHDRAQYHSASLELTSRFAAQQRVPEKEQTAVLLPNANRNEGDLRIPAAAVRYLQSADNYVEVFFTEGRTLRREMIRATLKTLAEALEVHPNFLRCHKSFIVNLDAVERVSGNAQGLKLHLRDCQEVIPVSRNFNDLIRERLPVRP